MTPVKVLIIDDDIMMSDLLMNMINELGNVEAIAVMDGDAALNYPKDCFDLILMDWKLPGLRGLSLFQALKYHNQNALIYIMSGFALEDIASEIDPDRFMQKPFKSKAVQDIVLTLRGVIKAPAAE